jgi:type IV pilus assembly protein PilW
MNPHRPSRLTARPPRQQGLTLVELMIAMGIAVFLLAGLLTIVDNTRRTFTTQNVMAQLQDNERLAMTLLGDVIQSAGYFPDPTLYTANGSLPADATFASAGQAIVGTANAALPGDTITIRFLTVPNDNVMNCTGGTNPGGGPQLYTNAFSVDLQGNLRCAVNGAASVPLVSGVQNLRILYGVKTNFAVDNGAADSYLRANEMLPAYWSNVITVKLVLTFVNPLAGLPNQPPSILFERVVDVMSRSGVKT